MKLDIALVAADTTRSRAYLSAMVRHNLLPNYVLLLKNPQSTLLPGQSLDPTANLEGEEIADCWSEAVFDTSFSVEGMLDNLNVEYDIAQSENINDPSTIKYIASRGEEVFIYSGFGGVILRGPVLSIGKKFLHVHGGYLPEYKGSTTNYFSLLRADEMGASAIFLTEDIDSGPILHRMVFPTPPDRQKIDHVYDSAVRAKVLVEVLKKFKDTGIWEVDLENSGGTTYYVIHPVLKHIAILSKSRGEMKK